MSGLCKYKNIIGSERTGMHSIRVFDIAIIDLLITLFAAYAFAYYTGVSFSISVILFITLGIVVHRLFCVNSKINTMIFGYI